MPLYSYECSHCQFNFDEFHNLNEGNCGKTSCQKCGNTAFKIPAIFNARIFKKRRFADGTSTPDHVNTPRQERDWMKSQGITYDAPTGNEKRKKQEERKIKSETSMSKAFRDAVNKCEQGLKIENVKQKEVKKINFNV